MVPDPNRKQPSFKYLEYPILRDVNPRTPHQFIKGKQLQDGAEGLWRIHNSIYDLTEFINKHPGGKQWIEFTKGTDITEAFETHHLTEYPEQLLPKFFVKKTNELRNYPFTFENDGFYKTLKAKVAKKLKEIPPSARKRSDMVMNILIFAVFALSSLCCITLTRNLILSSVLILVNGFLLSCLTVCAHNYLHRRDSWRMYVFNLGGLSFQDWRISHSLSHHMYTNTVQDIELSMLEPFLHYLPDKNKPWWAQMATFYWPVIFPFVYLVLLFKEVAAASLNLEQKRFTKANIIPFILPTWMWLSGGMSFLVTIVVWIAVELISSFVMMFFGLTAGHHDNRNFFDGDVPRNSNPDWGIHQLDTVVERYESMGNHVASITTFGDHALHHLFPTLDHAELEYLYPTLLQHCEKYNIPLRTTSLYKAVICKSKQLARKEPNDFSKKVIRS